MQECNFYAKNVFFKKENTFCDKAGETGDGVLDSTHVGVQLTPH